MEEPKLTSTKSSKKRKRSKKERHVDQAQSTEPAAAPSAKKKRQQPLNGLTLAISTLDVKDTKHSSVDSSYQAVAALCKELGAQVCLLFYVYLYRCHVT